MSYERISPAKSRAAPLRPASDGVTRLIRRETPRQVVRAPLVLDRAALVDAGLWGFAPLDPRARAFVRLRSQLLSRLSQAPRKNVIAVVSPRAGDGKSFVAANLAAALSQIHSVCLVDLDLRAPAIGALLGAPDCVGVETLLAGERRLAEVGCLAVDAPLVVLPVQHSPGDATPLLAADGVRELFDALRRDTETICLVDTPPILGMDDAVLIARHVDGVLLVVEEGRTPARDVREALRLLQPAVLVGTVLNRSLGGAG